MPELFQIRRRLPPCALLCRAITVMNDRCEAADRGWARGVTNDSPAGQQQRRNKVRWAPRLPRSSPTDCWYMKVRAGWHVWGRISRSEVARRLMTVTCCAQ